MRRTLAAFVLCVALPALGLAYLGLRGGDDFERREIERLRSRARAALAPARAAMSRAVASRTARADAFLRAWAQAPEPDGDRPLVFVARDGRAVPRPPPNDVGPEERRLFEHGLRGGEREEFIRRDPLAAAEMYTFFLHRLRSPSLRSASVYRAARCLRKAGDRRLAGALYREVAERYAGVIGPEDEPLDLLALLALHRMGAVEKADLLARMGRLGHRAGRGWPRALFHALGESPPEPDPIAEASLEALRERGRVPEEFAFAGRLFRFRPCAGSDILAGTWIDLTPSEIEASQDPRHPDGMEVRFEPLRRRELLPAGREIPARPPGGRELAAELVRTRSGTPLGFALARSPRLAEIRAEAGRRRRWVHAIVALLVLVAAAGGFLVARALRAELQLLKLKSEFIANVSHEVKTPVSAVRMFAEMLAEEDLEPEKTREFARVLRAESERLSAIVENVLDFARLERGELELPAAPIELPALLRRVAGGFSLRAEREGVRFRAEIDGVGSVRSNAGAIARIVQNLLDNAFKYRRAEDPEVSLTARSSGRDVRIEVRDNGVGIPRAARERIFEKFYRGPPGDRGVRGTGMGLALARALARRLGGEIGVESRRGEGSVFTLTLPHGGGERRA